MVKEVTRWNSVRRVLRSPFGIQSSVAKSFRGFPFHTHSSHKPLTAPSVCSPTSNCEQPHNIVSQDCTQCIPVNPADPRTRADLDPHIHPCLTFSLCRGPIMHHPLQLDPQLRDIAYPHPRHQKIQLMINTSDQHLRSTPHDWINMVPVWHDRHRQTRSLLSQWRETILSSHMAAFRHCRCGITWTFSSSFV